jgi:hypothetical protein
MIHNTCLVKIEGRRGGEGKKGGVAQSRHWHLFYRLQLKGDNEGAQSAVKGARSLSLAHLDQIRVPCRVNTSRSWKRKEKTARNSML